MDGFTTKRIGFKCEMCGECCKRYMVPVNLSDIRHICESTHLEPVQFLELVAPDKSVAHTYYEIPKIELEPEENKVLCLKEVRGGCIFLGGKGCAIYKARPLRCRPFPFSYERRGGEIVFTVNEEASGFCKGLSGEAKEFSFVELSNIVLEMEKEQEAFRRRIRDWNREATDRGRGRCTLSDFLKFLLQHTRYV